MQRPESPLTPRSAALVVGLAIAAAILFYSTMLFGGSLHGYDWASHHYHYFDWLRISLTQFHTLPLFMNRAWITKNFLANAESPILGPLVPLLLLLPTDAYLKLLLVLFTAAGLTGMFLLLRDLRVGREIAGFTAIVFAFNGFFVSHLAVGHHWAMGAQLLPGLLCLYRRAALGSARALWAAAAVNAWTILGGQHQPFIWQNLLIALFALAWSLRLRSLRPLASWAWLVLATTALGAVKLLPLLAEFADYAPTARVQGLPLRLLLSTLMAGGQHPELVAPGVAYAHGSGWWEFAFYVGPLAFGCMLAGLVCARRCWPMLAIGAFFLLLALEWPAPLRWLDPWPWLEELPVWRTQRGPSRLLFLALFACSVASASGLQRLWERDLRRWPRALPALALALTALVAVDLYLESRPWQRAAVGAALPSWDHRPRPLVLGRPEVATAELREFEPNRLVYRVRATRGGRIVFPFRYGKGAPEWHIEGLPEGLPAISQRGKLAVDLPPGERDIVMSYRPRYFCAGLATSGITLVGLGLWALRSLAARRRERDPGAHDAADDRSQA